MIQSFGDRATQRFFQGGRIPDYDGFRRQAERRLTMLNAATSLQDLRELQGNRLKLLSGKRAGQYSIRINRKWRLCFFWGNDGPHSVEIVNYH